MKKYIATILSAALMLNSGFAFADVEPDISLNATVDDFGNITVSGSVLNTDEDYVSVMIKKPQGENVSLSEITASNFMDNVETVAQTAIKSDNTYSFKHSLKGDFETGNYVISVGLLGTTFETITVNYEVNELVTTNAYASSDGKLYIKGKVYGMSSSENLEIAIVKPGYEVESFADLTDENTEAILNAVVGDDYTVTAEHMLTDKTLTGKYRVLVRTSYKTECGAENEYASYRGDGFNHPINIFVSTDGTEQGSGSEQYPFSSIEEALALSEEISAVMTEDVNIYLRGGEYKIDNAINISENNAKSLTISSYPGESAVLTGGVDVTGWTAGENGIWYADAKLSDFRELYVNGEPATRARSAEYKGLGWYNNSGQDYKDTVDTGETVLAGKLHTRNSPYTGGGFNAPKGYRGGLVIPDVAELDGIEGWNNISDIELVRNKLWLSNRIGAASVFEKDGEDIGAAGNYSVVVFDKEQSYWSTDYLPSWPWLYNDDFYVENALELLDEPGEWYYDKTNERLYYMPASGVSMNTARFEVPQLDKQILKIEGTYGNDVKNVSVKDLEFKCSTWNSVDDKGYSVLQAGVLMGGETAVMQGAILLNYVDNIEFSGCIINNLGLGGISGEDGIKNLNINNSVIKNVGGNGISIGRGAAHINDTIDAGEEVCSEINIENNLIYDCANQYYSNCGITIYAANNTTIKNNEIYGLPYTGVSIGWGWEAYPDATACHSNVVSHNYIHDVMEVLEHDGGAIYTQGTQPDSYILNNYLYLNHLVYAGIYHDAGSKYYKDNNNVIETANFSPNDLYYPEIEGFTGNAVGYTWVCMQATGASDLSADNNYVDGIRTNGEGSNNCVVTNTHYYPNHNWPAEAQKIISEAGVKKLSVSNVGFFENYGTESQRLVSSFDGDELTAVYFIRNLTAEDFDVDTYVANYTEDSFNFKRAQKVIGAHSSGRIELPVADFLNGQTKVLVWDANMVPLIDWVSVNN